MGRSYIFPARKSGRMLDGMRRAAAVLALLLGVSISGAGQSTLIGTVSIDSAGKHPMAGIEVSIPALHLTSKTDSTGTYRLDGLALGKYTVVVRAVGYQPIIAEIQIEAPDATLQNFWVERLAQPLDTVRAKDKKTEYISPALRGFEERRRAGFGHFLGEEQLRKMDNRRVGDVVTSFPGVTILRSGAKAFASSTRKPNGPTAVAQGPCYVAVYLDGVETKDTGLRGGKLVILPPNLNDINVDQLAAIEFYAGEATAPLGFHQNGCGLLLLWTRER